MKRFILFFALSFCYLINHAQSNPDTTYRVFYEINDTAEVAPQTKAIKIDGLLFLVTREVKNGEAIINITLAKRRQKKLKIDLLCKVWLCTVM